MLTFEPIPLSVHFKIKLHSELFQQMRILKENVFSHQDMHLDKSMVMLCYMGHGRERGILAPAKKKVGREFEWGRGGNAYGWAIPDLIDVFSKNKSLENKPKVMFFCACRGENYAGTPEKPALGGRKKTTLATKDRDFEAFETTQSDMFVGFSTTPGLVTTVNDSESQSGTNFYQALSYCLTHYEDQDLTKIFKEVTNMVSKSGDHIPQQQLTLLGDLFFPTKRHESFSKFKFKLGIILITIFFLIIVLLMP